MIRLKNIYSTILEWNWYLFFALLPFTGFPLLASITRSMVAPPSVLIILILGAFWLFPHVIKKGCIPSPALPIILFTFIAMVSSAFAFFRIVPEYKGLSITGGALKGVITLLLGLLTYIIVATFPKNFDQIKIALRIINWVGFVVLLWTAFRAGYWYLTGTYPDWLEMYQKFFSTGQLTTGRAVGFTMEPSWLAHQLNMLFLPFWLAASYQKSSVHSKKIFGISFENILLLGGVITLFLTLSRVGIAAFFLVLAIVFVLINNRWITWLDRKLVKLKNNLRSRTPRQGSVRKAIITSCLVIIYLFSILSVATLLTKLDPRMENLFKFEVRQQNAILDYANELKFGERITYWIAGWNIFNAHPIIGVGLGMAGFYIPAQLPYYSWNLVEVRNIAFRSNMLFNIKSVWLRILAETGLVGFCFFLGWLFLIYQSARFLQKNANTLVRTIGFAGLFMLVGFLVDGFNVDSFALPYVWILTGLVTASSKILLTDKLQATAN
jgi:hypothetical protein